MASNPIYSISHANAKQHIVSQLVGDLLVWDARFQDAAVANSNTSTADRTEC
jgi:hypothetical protein